MKIRLVLLLCLIAGLSLSPWLGAQAPQPPAPPPPAARLTILDDNTVARPGVKAVWGFACLAEAGGHTVLFDTGADPAVLKDNLAALKIDPSRIEAVVISHYHGDHTWGAPGLGNRPGVPVYTPRSFADHPKEAAALASAGLTLVPVCAMTPLFAGIAISEPLHFTDRIATGKAGTGFHDDLWEECLTVDTPEGLVVIVGCSHPGILTLLDQVSKEHGRPIALVIGGFHLLGDSRDHVRSIAASMKAMGVRGVSATHCTGGLAEAVFREEFGDSYVDAGVGAVITTPLAAKER